MRYHPVYAATSGVVRFGAEELSLVRIESSEINPVHNNSSPLNILQVDARALYASRTWRGTRSCGYIRLATYSHCASKMRLDPVTPPLALHIHLTQKPHRTLHIWACGTVSLTDGTGERPAGRRTLSSTCLMRTMETADLLQGRALPPSTIYVLSTGTSYSSGPCAGTYVFIELSARIGYFC